MKSVRESFVEHFGEEEAEAIENAALEHENGSNSAKKGSDPFKWAILITLGYQCVSVYAEYHGIKIPYEDFRKWVREHGQLASHVGDCDYLSLLSGAYNEFMSEEVKS